MARLLILVLIFILTFPSCLISATITAEDCQNTETHPHVQEAINSSSANDTVIIPAGSCTWTSTVVVTKGITIQGEGIGNTIITSNIADQANGLISYKPDAAAVTADNLFRITGFTFDLNNVVNGAHGVYLYNSSSTPVTKTRVDHNRFVNSLNGSGTKRMIYVIGSIYGVADSNVFEQCNHCIDGEGAGSSTEWVNLPRTYGTYENFYAEDNTFTNNDVSYAPVFMAGGHGGRYATRYNTFNITGTAYNVMLFDVHGNQTAGYGMMVNELYGNKFNMKPVNNGNYIIDQRGSRVLMFYNQLNTHTATTGHYNRIREEVADSNANAPSGNPGTFLMHVTDSYYWNNRHSSNGGYLINANLDADSCTVDAGYGLDPAACYNTGGTEGIKENIDWFNHNTSYNGTTETGIYCGASLPANCTTGDGAWITNQSCSSVDDAHVGANPSTPISGTLYKCTSTNKWEPYYTPYTYPHPLRGGNRLSGGVVAGGTF